MKHFSLKILPVAIFVAGISFFSCKGKNNTSSTADTTTTVNPMPDTTTMQPEPVPVNPDDSLTTMAKDAVKDYPGVTATVNNGEVTLTGDITRAKLPKLMMAVNAIHPKKVNNNLTIK